MKNQTNDRFYEQMEEAEVERKRVFYKRNWYVDSCASLQEKNLDWYKKGYITKEDYNATLARLIKKEETILKDNMMRETN